jgi:hypothetical protein
MSDDICGSTNTSSGDPCKWNVAEKGECPFHNTDDPPDNGRESKLSYERQEKIAGAIEQGKSITSAARMAGISRNAVYDWLERGETDKQEGKDNEYVDFYDRVTRARGHGEDKYFQTVWQMAKEDGDHRFLASLMKQRYPDSWGETDTGVDADTVTIEVSENVKSSWPQIE